MVNKCNINAVLGWSNPNDPIWRLNVRELDCPSVFLETLLMIFQQSRWSNMEAEARDYIVTGHSIQQSYSSAIGVKGR